MKEKAVKLFNAITNISDAHIGSAEPAPRSRRHIARFLAAAACLAVVAASASVFSVARANDDFSNLPMIRCTEDTQGGYGFEGYMAYDISELVSGNPWTEGTKIKKLPVYENEIKYDCFMNTTDQDLDKMQEYLVELVNKVGLNKDDLTFKGNAPIEKQIKDTMEGLESKGTLPVPDNYFAPTELTATDGNIKITVDEHMNASIWFENGMDLPPEYNYNYHAPLSDISAVAGYLKEEYVLGRLKDIIGMKDPQVNIRGGDYNIYGQQDYNIYFFDKGSDDIESIVNYNLRYVSFSCNEEGQLWIIRINNIERTKKLGDYPIISVKEAKKLLLDGYYATSVVQWDMPGEEYIAKVELIYRTDSREEIFMPYYKFLIELPEAPDHEQGFKTFGAYYVPAVEGKYIENMPKYDGSFN